MSDSQNYLANVRCPHCQRACVVSISGFGGELSTRAKVCRACGAEYYVHLLTVTSAEPTVPDGEISGIRDRISYLAKARRETLSTLLLRHELAVRLNREALDEARRMRDQHDQN